MTTPVCCKKPMVWQPYSRQYWCPQCQHYVLESQVHPLLRPVEFVAASSDGRLTNIIKGI
jgi:hypothetical protein